MCEESGVAEATLPTSLKKVRACEEPGRKKVGEKCCYRKPSI